MRGVAMAPISGRRVLADPEILPGGQLAGRVLRSDGSPIPNAEISYSQLDDGPFGTTTVLVTKKATDAEGRYNLDYVLKNPLGPFTIRARDLATREERSLQAQVHVDGEHLRLDLVLVGRGSVQGTVRDPTGAPPASRRSQLTL